MCSFFIMNLIEFIDTYDDAILLRYFCQKITIASYYFWQAEPMRISRISIPAAIGNLEFFMFSPS